MLASAEPETMKSTVAMVGLKAVGDLKQFCELNSTTAAVDQMRDSSSLPTGAILNQNYKVSSLYFPFS